MRVSTATQLSALPTGTEVYVRGKNRVFVYTKRDGDRWSDGRDARSNYELAGVIERVSRTGKAEAIRP